MLKSIFEKNGGIIVPEPEKKKAELKISGMTCATCAFNIEDSLSKIEDVSSKAQVNFGTDTAHVEFA